MANTSLFKLLQTVVPTNYLNCKRKFSLALLALVDAHYNLIAVNVGSYANNSDGRILAH